MTRQSAERVLHIYQLGSLDYQKASELQDSLAASIATQDHPDSLLLLEHPHVYTFGRRGDEANLLWDPEKLEQRGISVHWNDRGGDVTYHGPGQLVGYPLLNLGAGEGDRQIPGRTRRRQRTNHRSHRGLGATRCGFALPPLPAGGP
jgi:lipoyl(octanoyl) transferase